MTTFEMLRHLVETEGPVTISKMAVSPTDQFFVVAVPEQAPKGSTATHTYMEVAIRNLFRQRQERARSILLPETDDDEPGVS